MIRLEGERLADLATGRLDAHVPQYPSWKMEGLVAHTGAAFGRTAIVCRTLPQERVSSPRPEPGDDIINWYRQQLEDCLAELAHADLDTHVWAFTATPTLRFWLRRMATEAGVHRWDAGHAVGETSPLLDEVAQLGLDEVETLWMPWAGELSGSRSTLRTLVVLGTTPGAAKVLWAPPRICICGSWPGLQRWGCPTTGPRRSTRFHLLRVDLVGV